MNVRGTAVLSLFLLSLATPAFADDPPAPPPPPKRQAGASLWSGAYVGVSGGLGFRGEPIKLTGQWGPEEFIASGAVPDAIAKDASGWLAGGTVGFLHQAGAGVFGIEGDFSMTQIEKIEDATGVQGVERYTHGEKKLDWLGTIRGRAGVAAGHAVIYGTGGLAFSRATSAVMLTTTTKNNMAGCIAANIGLCVADEQEKVVNGWVIGGGAEFRGGGRASFKIEYLLYDMNEIETEGIDIRFPAGVQPTLIGTDRVKGSIFRAGVNFRF